MGIPVALLSTELLRGRREQGDRVRTWADLQVWEERSQSEVWCLSWEPLSLCHSGTQDPLRAQQDPESRHHCEPESVPGKVGGFSQSTLPIFLGKQAWTPDGAVL